jgi:hypothetical protein
MFPECGQQTPTLPPPSDTNRRGAVKSTQQHANLLNGPDSEAYGYFLNIQQHFRDRVSKGMIADDDYDRYEPDNSTGGCHASGTRHAEKFCTTMNSSVKNSLNVEKLPSKKILASALATTES